MLKNAILRYAMRYTKVGGSTYKKYLNVDICTNGRRNEMSVHENLYLKEIKLLFKPQSHSKGVTKCQDKEVSAHLLSQEYQKKL